MFAAEEARLIVEEFSDTALETAVAQRVQGVPLEQILGWAEFCDRRIVVEPGVFVPRRRSKLLVDVVVVQDPSRVLDMCCGSGAIGAVIKSALQNADVHASDIDAAAVHCARRNLEPLGGHVHCSDMYSALPEQLRGTFEVIVANAPYVPTDAIASMPPEARDHEPRSALDGGVDGLALQRRVAGEARDWLAPDGCIVIETSRGQAAATSNIVESAGFVAEIERSDDLGGTAVIGRSRWPASPIVSTRP